MLNGSKKTIDTKKGSDEKNDNENGTNLIWPLTMLLFAGLNLQCTSKGNNNSKSAETTDDSCVTIYAEDERASKIFSELFVTDYEKVSSLSIPGITITFEPIKNAFDSSKIDSIAFIKI